MIILLPSHFFVAICWTDNAQGTGFTKIFLMPEVPSFEPFWNSMPVKHKCEPATHLHKGKSLGIHP